jgi:hypothetical protein
MKTNKITAALQPANVERFQTALSVLELGVKEHHIWNVDFQNAKDTVSRCIEQAMTVAAEPFYVERRASNDYDFSHNDPRYDISGYMTPISAPKLLRNLEKKNGYANTIILEYMEYLRELVEIGKFIKEVKPFIEKGRKPNVTNKTPEALAAEIANTGTCTICQNRQKLTDEQKMVHHGYQMSEYNHSGYRVGRCFGCDFLPYEFSCEGNKQWLAQVLRPQLAGNRKYLKELKASTMLTLDRTREKYEGGKRTSVTETFAKGTPEYEEIRENMIYRTESNIRLLKIDVEMHEGLVKAWVFRPLMDGTTKNNFRFLAIPPLSLV